MPETPRSAALLLLIVTLAAVTGCSDQEAEPDSAPAATAAAVDTPLAQPPSDEDLTRPAEIYFDLTAFGWYREGRPLVHQGRSYMPQAEPITVTGELREAGSYEGVTYYVSDEEHEPVYTLFVPVYYRYWQRFTAPPPGA